MSKLEIISDIVVNDLNRFEKNRQKFADDLERLEKTQIKFETEKARELLTDMDVVFLKEEHRRNDFLNRLNSILERAKIYPNWAIKTFVIMVVVLVISLGFSIYFGMALEDVRRKGYDEGMQVYGEYMNSFFEENPEINEVYTKWLRTKN